MLLCIRNLGSRRVCLLFEHGGGCFLLVSNTRKCKNESFSFLDACMEGGDGMDAVTWHDLIYLLMEIATLIIVILSYLNSKKR